MGAARVCVHVLMLFMYIDVFLSTSRYIYIYIDVLARLARFLYPNLDVAVAYLFTFVSLDP